MRKIKDFETVYMEHFADVYRFILSLCRDEQLAEEITQETFFKALKKIDEFKGNCKLSVWLCQIAKNTYFSHQRKKQPEPLERAVEVLGASSALQESMVAKESSEQLHYHLHHLKEPYKEVFTLRVFGELSHGQIAALFGKNESWARVIFYRAKKQLQEAMK
ncbi:RNA polymerase sigma factor [Enterococcus sp. LJL128]|uniref:RNA polymerase sigma factor n=1 Tax=Enterococcus sp. LJL51 TaxID=3416656 RepID=UPI003CF14B66